MNRKQRRTFTKRPDLPSPASIRIPPDDIPTVERMIAREQIADDDPEYLLIKMLMLGMEPPLELAERAREHALAIHQAEPDNRQRAYRAIARSQAIERKILFEPLSRNQAN